MPGVTQEQIAAARRMSAIEFLQKYRPNSLVKSSARGEYQLAEHDSFKINAESSVWHWKSRDIGGKSASAGWTATISFIWNTFHAGGSGII